MDTTVHIDNTQRARVAQHGLRLRQSKGHSIRGRSQARSAVGRHMAVRLRHERLGTRLATGRTVRGRWLGDSCRIGAGSLRHDGMNLGLRARLRYPRSWVYQREGQLPKDQLLRFITGISNLSTATGCRAVETLGRWTSLATARRLHRQKQAEEKDGYCEAKRDCTCADDPAGECQSASVQQATRSLNPAPRHQT
jgi:hypothetical protein